MHRLEIRRCSASEGERMHTCSTVVRASVSPVAREPNAQRVMCTSMCSCNQYTMKVFFEDCFCMYVTSMQFVQVQVYGGGYTDSFDARGSLSTRLCPVQYHIASATYDYMTFKQTKNSNAHRFMIGISSQLRLRPIPRAESHGLASHMGTLVLHCHQCHVLSDVLE